MNNHDATEVPPGNHRNGPYVLIAIGFISGLAIWNDPANNHAVVYIERAQATDDACGGIFSDSRGVPYYYASDHAVDSTHPVFYVDSPINRPNGRATSGSY